MRQLRVENTLYDLPDDVWRQVNDLLSKTERTTPLTQEMLKDEIPLDQATSGSAEGGHSPDDQGSAKPLGEDLADENRP